MVGLRYTRKLLLYFITKSLIGSAICTAASPAQLASCALAVSNKSISTCLCIFSLKATLFLRKVGSSFMIDFINVLSSSAAKPRRLILDS